MAELAQSHVRKLVVEDTGGMRISSGAIPVAIEAGADYLRKLGKRAAGIARAHGRKTIMEEDIATARTQIWGE